MSEQNLTKKLQTAVGFYGKLPSLGDFVSRRLPQDFILPWDSWMQSSMAASRELLADAWLQCYLTSPIWHFALSPGLVGKSAWVGIVMPSVDRVGRYFPLTIACQYTLDVPLIRCLTVGGDWFQALEEIAINGLENDLLVEEFDQLLKQLPDLQFKGWKGADAMTMQGQEEESRAFYLQFENPSDTAQQAYPDLTTQLLQSCLPAHSLWYSSGAEKIKPGFLVVDGLPPCSAYAGMLTGQFQQTGWRLQQHLIGTLNLSILSRHQNQPNGVSVEPELQKQQNEAGDEPQQQKPREIMQNAILATPEQRSRAKGWKSFSRTDVGKVREYNEDAILDRPDLGIWAVADGMGGHQAGDIASGKIVKTLNSLHFGLGLESLVVQVKAALQLVNNELLELSVKSYHQNIIGSTVVVLLAGESEFCCLWAGDSRLYRLRERKLTQLTSDHCAIQEDMTRMIEDDSISELKVNNIITRAVGAYQELELDRLMIEVQSGDLYLLSSDGLDKEVALEEIEQVLINNVYNDCVEILLEQVLQKGGRDNVSVIVVTID